MQSIQPNRSKFKKQTKNYVQDNILDIIDIEETLLKNRYIEKVNKQNFLYSKCLSSYNNLSKPVPKIKPLKITQFPKEKLLPIKEIKPVNNNINVIINNNNNNGPRKSLLNIDNINFEALNKNKFDINFNKLKLEYKHGYKVLFIDEYFPVEIIGAGSFGLVIHVIQIKTNLKMAVKIINKKNANNNSHFDYLNNEVNILKMLDNPRIMKIYNILDNNHYFFIFMELIEGGNLKDLIIKRYLDNNKYLFRDSECSLIMKGIFEALNYLHKKNIIHRDIKPENILFKNKDDLSSVILCDFGLAYHLNEYEKSISGFCGTTIYMAPEILLKRNYDSLIDSFSAGIVLYILCSGGMHPFYTNDISSKEYIKKNLEQKFLCKFSTEMPLLARNLFLKLCKFEPIFRYEIFKALNHPWITRSTKSQIPMTILEEYNKNDKIKNFQALLSSSVSLIILKIYFNLKRKGDDYYYNYSYINRGRNSTKTINKIHQILNIEDKYLLLSTIKKNSKKLLKESSSNDEKEKDNKLIINNYKNLGLNTPNSSLIMGQKANSKNGAKIISRKNIFIKTGVSYNQINNNENNENNENNKNNDKINELKPNLRSLSSKEIGNQTEQQNNLSKSKKTNRNKQMKSHEHIYINDINKKMEDNKNNNIYIQNSYRKNGNNIFLNLNVNKYNNIQNNNKIFLKKHIVIESKNKNRNFVNDIMKSNSISLSTHKNNENMKKKLNLQIKYKDNNLKDNNQINNFRNIFINSKSKTKNLLLKEPFNGVDL